MVSTTSRELKIILLTGPAGVGKTTMVNRVCDHFSDMGVRIGGITTREVREGQQRIGFKIKDLSSGQEGWLARKEPGAGSRIGSYRVISENLDTIGVAAMVRAVEPSTELVIVDEIGPIEMTSLLFRESVQRVLSGNLPIIATIKYGSHFPETDRIRDRTIGLEISRDNREQIYQRLVQQVEVWIGQRRS